MQQRGNGRDLVAQVQNAAGVTGSVGSDVVGVECQ